MSLSYKAPIADMQFILYDVFNAKALWQSTEKLAHVDEDTVSMILDEMAKFSENEILPLNQSGDDEGATYAGDGVVTTPKGYKDAFMPTAKQAGLDWAVTLPMTDKACQKW